MEADTQLYYVAYDEHAILLYTSLDEVLEDVANGSTLYGYVDNECSAQQLLEECFKYLATQQC